MAAAVVGLHESTPFPGYAVLLPDCGAALLIIGGTSCQGGVTRMLRARWLTWIGDRSYGWHLLPWPFISFTRSMNAHVPILLLAGVAELSLLPAALSYRYLENRVRTSRGYVGRRAIALATVCCSIPVIASMSLLASTQCKPSKMRVLQAQYQPHLDATHSCQDNLPGDARTTGSGTLHTVGVRGTIVLVGYSNAGHFAEPLAAAARAARFDFILATFGGCPFADVVTQYHVLCDEAGCHAFVDSWTAAVSKSPCPGGVGKRFNGIPHQWRRALVPGSARSLGSRHPNREVAGLAPRPLCHLADLVGLARAGAARDNGAALPPLSTCDSAPPTASTKTKRPARRLLTAGWSNKRSGWPRLRRRKQALECHT